MKNITTNTARKIAAIYATHKGHWMTDFPAFTSIVMASAITLLVVGMFTQINAGSRPDSWATSRQAVAPANAAISSLG